MFEMVSLIPSKPNSLLDHRALSWNRFQRGQRGAKMI